MADIGVERILVVRDGFAIEFLGSEKLHTFGELFPKNTFPFLFKEFLNQATSQSTACLPRRGKLLYASTRTLFLLPAGRRKNHARAGSRVTLEDSCLGILGMRSVFENIFIFFSRVLSVTFVMSVPVTVERNEWLPSDSSLFGEAIEKCSIGLKGEKREHIFENVHTIFCSEAFLAENGEI